MSRQYDAKQAALKAYPTDRQKGVDLFYGYMKCDVSDFEYEEGMTAEEYVYGSIKGVSKEAWEAATDSVAKDIKLSRYKDIILEAINEYDQWMLDDDYDSGPVLDRIITRMKTRISMDGDN